MSRKISVIGILAILLSAGGICGSAQAQEALFDNRKTEWKIYLPAKADPAETYASEELQVALKKISGVDFMVVKGGEIPSRNAIILGSLESSPEIKSKTVELKLKADKVEQLAVYTIGNNLYLAGNNPRGCLYAVYSFLERELGVRWLWPGDDGEFMPAKNRFALPKLAWNYAPSFRFREMTPCGLHKHVPTEIWMARNFLNNGSRTESVRDKAGFVRADSTHSVSLSYNNDPEKEFKSHPEYFSMVNGSRVVEGIAGCWSNPGFEQKMIQTQIELIKSSNAELLNIFPADVTLRCECRECTKNPDPSSRWFDFYHKIILSLKKEFPDLKFGNIAYQEYRAVPATEVKGLEYVEYCQYNRCYVHKLDDKDCQLNAKSVAELKEWQKKAPMGIYGYEFDVFEPVIYVPFWNMLADEIKAYRNMKLVIMKTEMGVNYSKEIPREDLAGMKLRLPYYLYARLVWNPDADVNTLIADWCRNVYGPGADAMFAYHQAMANAWDSMKLHLSYFGASPNSMAKYFLNPALIKLAGENFRKAAKAIAEITDPAQRARIQSELELEQALFRQWEKLYRASRENLSILQLPLLKGDQAFAQAAKMPMKSKTGKHKPTESFIYWTNDGLHLRVICYDPQITELKKGSAGRDVELWSNDHLEIFLDCDDGKAYRHLALNPAGGFCDAEGMDTSWNPDWQVKTVIGKDRWTADVRLPFAAFGKTPKGGDRWILVLTRNSQPEDCGWPIPAYHDLGAGGIIIFKSNQTK
jgi:hypothetical protein